MSQFKKKIALPQNVLSCLVPNEAVDGNPKSGFIGGTIVTKVCFKGFNGLDCFQPNSNFGKTEQILFLQF